MLTSIEKVAVAEVIKNIAKEKKSLGEGSYKVNGVFKICAEINKSADETKSCIASLPIKDLTCALLSNMNENGRKAFIRNFISDNIKTHGYTEKNLAEEWEAIADKTTKIFSGKTKVTGTIEKV